MSDEARQAEIDKYQDVYKDKFYRMRGARHTDCTTAVRQSRPSSLLDVGCGRGEILELADNLGASPVRGVEVVDALIDGARVVYGQAVELPFTDEGFDVVTCFDVLEHLPIGDEVLALQELRRVSSRVVIVSANNRPAIKQGVELHVNRRPYDEWSELIAENVGGQIHMPVISYVSPIWVCQLK